MRLALVVYLADSLSRRQSIIRDFKQGFLPHLAVVASAMGLIVFQPDLGTALAIGITCTLMLYMGGIRPGHLVGTVIALLPFLYLIIFVIGYRKDRILTFLNPSDEQGAAYHITQSLLALGSGAPVEAIVHEMCRRGPLPQGCRGAQPQGPQVIRELGQC